MQFRIRQLVSKQWTRFVINQDFFCNSCHNYLPFCRLIFHPLQGNHFFLHNYFWTYYRLTIRMYAFDIEVFGLVC